MTASASGARTKQRSGLVTLAIGWAVLFGIAHVYWAVGGTLGVPGGTEPIAERPVFLAYDVVSGVLCFAAAALLAARPTPGRRRLLVIGTWVLVVRCVLGVLTDIGLAVSGDLTATVLYDVWFLVGTALFVLVVRPSVPFRR